MHRENHPCLAVWVPILGDGLTGRSRQVNDVCLGDAVRDLVNAVGPGGLLERCISRTRSTLRGAIDGRGRPALGQFQTGTGETASGSVVVRAWDSRSARAGSRRRVSTSYRAWPGPPSAAIAALLVVSGKTLDHDVSAILRRLEFACAVSDRGGGSAGLGRGWSAQDR
jgi:hypothetical protein